MWITMIDYNIYTQQLLAVYIMATKMTLHVPALSSSWETTNKASYRMFNTFSKCSLILNWHFPMSRLILMTLHLLLSTILFRINVCLSWSSFSLFSALFQVPPNPPPPISNSKKSCVFLLVFFRTAFPADLITFLFTFCPNSKLPILWIAKQPLRRWGVERGRLWRLKGIFANTITFLNGNAGL